MNFPLILVIATFVTGLIWLIDALVFAPRRRTRADNVSGGKVHVGKASTGHDDHDEPLLVEYARSFFPVLFIVLILRSFLFEPFRIPSGSMIPTLLVGDFILVSKFSYGVRLPVINKKILDIGEPERGDVAVFRYPLDPALDYIKRVVGLPGDTVVYRDKTFFINGEEMPVSGDETYEMPGTDAIQTGVTLREEVLGDVTHDILVESGLASLNGEFKVPPGHYLMVGDNRDNSNDGRSWGFVPEENLVGEAKYIWMHWSGGVLWSRLGDKIR